MSGAPGYRRPAAWAWALMLWTLTAAAGEPATDGAQIIIQHFMFSPAALTIKAGTTVRWLNKDDEPHTVVSGALFRSAALDTGDTFSFRFDQPGTYAFVCTIHPMMNGTITVE